jgi:glutamyl-tRNA synthetase/nondiscriminating glutamyl-tRNA synthetase
MLVRVRFAPSPTGHLHVGNARTALFNWLFARSQGGVFVLRIEDTDVERSEARFEPQLMDDLRWFGLNWDEGPDIGGPHAPYRQSERIELYRLYAEKLIEAGAAYYCFCSPEQLEADRQAALAEGRQPMYSGRCRQFDPAEARTRQAAHEPALVRLRIPPRPIQFIDLVHGPVEFTHEVIGDPVLLRSDGTPAYNYAVVIDDHLMEITHVIRGDDHLSNTPRQVAVYEALGWTPPKFAHLSTILGSDHTRLSKRHGATSVAIFRDMGVLPEALMNHLALLGWAQSETNREIFSRDELVRAFRLDQVSKNPAVFNPEKLNWLNRHYLKQADPERVLALATQVFREAGLLPAQMDVPVREWLRRVVELLLPSVDHVSQLPARADLIFEYDARAALQFAPNLEVLREAGAGDVLGSFLKHALAGGDLTLERYQEVLGQVKRETHQKGKALFRPVRVAITGYPSGPDLNKLMAILAEGSRLDLPRRVRSPRQRLEEFAAAYQGFRC